LTRNTETERTPAASLAECGTARQVTNNRSPRLAGTSMVIGGLSTGGNGSASPS